MSGRKPPSSRRGRQASKVNGNGRGAAFSESRIAGRVGELGREITRAYRGRRLDVLRHAPPHPAQPAAMP